MIFFSKYHFCDCYGFIIVTGDIINENPIKIWLNWKDLLSGVTLSFLGQPDRLKSNEIDNKMECFSKIDPSLNLIVIMDFKSYLASFWLVLPAMVGVESSHVTLSVAAWRRAFVAICNRNQINLLGDSSFGGFSGDACGMPKESLATASHFPASLSRRDLSGLRNSPLLSFLLPLQTSLKTSLQLSCFSVRCFKDS